MIVHTKRSGKSLQLLCILSFGILSLSAIRIIFSKIPVGFLVVCECSSVLLQYVFMLYVDSGDEGQVVR